MTITLNLRLRGGAAQNNPRSAGGDKRNMPSSSQQSNGGPSYKNILQGKKAAGSPPEQAGNTPRPYIVELQEQTPALKINNTATEEHTKTYEAQALICRFNCFWPKPMDLFHWIFTQWSLQCEIYLCSKGFFIVKFQTPEERDIIIREGPWFWGSTGLFITPWFPDFDPNTMTVSRLPVWARLHNLPLHFWNEQVLESIGNSLGRYIKTDMERLENRIFTFARICVEVDLSKGLPENIMLIYKQQNWLQSLDYENTAFRCRKCRMTGHLQNTCPEVKKTKGKKKPNRNQRKGWQFSTHESEEDESEEEEEPAPSESKQHTQDPPAPSESKQPTQKSEVQTVDTTVLMDPHHTTKSDRKAMDPGSGGIKRQHTSETSDSDKDIGTLHVENQIVLATCVPSQGEWRKVEKKKGRRER